MANAEWPDILNSDFARRHVAHGGIDLRADFLGFGAVEQVIEPRLGRQIQDALGMIGGGFIQP